LQTTLADLKIEIGNMDTPLVPPRLPASLATSAALHAIGLALAVNFAGVIATPHELPGAEIIPVSLVSLPGGGGGPKGDGNAAPPPAAAPPDVPPAAEARPAAPPPQPTRPAVKKRVPPARVAAEPAVPPLAAAVPSGGGAGEDSGAGHGPGGGDGSGGDGSGGTRPAYGSNPRPPYPLAARRLGLEGRVLLEVVVRPDGRAGSVTIRQSSGSGMLDDSAADTVRTRWRFVPARRDGIPVESTVTVPIRFRIRES
jgi:protein TonB